MRQTTDPSAAAEMRPSLLILALLVAPGCGARSHPPLPWDHIDHFETESELRLASPERCATGPFEVRLPARDVEFGRRVAFSVHGPRAIGLHVRVSYIAADGSLVALGSGAFPDDDPADHVRCRGARAASPDATTARVDPGEGGGAPREGALEAQEAGAPPLREAPTLTPFTEAMPLVRGAGAFAVYPHGTPNRRGEYGLAYHGYNDVPTDAGELVLQLWTLEPVDLDGIVLRIEDQTLIPDLEIEAYRAAFAERVRDEERRGRLLRSDRGRVASERDALCGVRPDDPRCAPPPRTRPVRPPPPPREETPPATPGAGVAWVGGFWRWDTPANDYFWVPGTFVVMHPPAAAPPAASPPPAVLPAVAVDARPLEASVPPNRRRARRSSRRRLLRRAPPGSRAIIDSKAACGSGSQAVGSFHRGAARAPSCRP